MYHLDDGYGAVLGLYLTTFAGTLPFPMDGEYQNCSMVEDPATGTLYLSYFTGNSTEFYGLYPQRDADGKIQSFRAGKLGAWRRMSGPWPFTRQPPSMRRPVANGCASSTGDATIQTAEFTAMDQVAMRNAVEEDIPHWNAACSAQRAYSNAERWQAPGAGGGFHRQSQWPCNCELRCHKR